VAVEGKHNEGVKLLELRFAPTFIAHGWGHSFSSILSAIQRGVKRACERCENGIHVGLICIAVGASGHQEFDRTATFALEHRDALVGFDIAGSELHPEQYAPWMDKIHEAGMPITIHAAEDRVSGLPENAAIAVDRLHARRIGHGIQTIKDRALWRRLIDQQVTFELCPTSNYLTNAVDSLEAHPIGEFLSGGARVCLSSDDPGIMACDLPREYEVCHEVLGLTEDDFRRMNVTALEASFCDDGVKASVRAKWANWFADSKPDCVKGGVR